MYTGYSDTRIISYYGQAAMTTQTQPSNHHPYPSHIAVLHRSEIKVENATEEGL